MKNYRKKSLKKKKYKKIKKRIKKGGSPGNGGDNEEFTNNNENENERNASASAAAAAANNNAVMSIEPVIEPLQQIMRSGSFYIHLIKRQPRKLYDQFYGKIKELSFEDTLKKLEDIGVIETSLKGMPATLHFKTVP